MKNEQIKQLQHFNDNRYIVLGMLVFLLVASAFVYWAFFSKLDSAAIAPGIISVEGQRKAVEHLEGGIVESVLVRDGDMVQENQPLIKLSAVAAKTRYTQLNLKYFGLLAQTERLHSERAMKEALIFSDKLLKAVSSFPSLAAVLDTQRYLFKARTDLRKSQMETIEAKLSGLQSDQVVLMEKMKQEKLALSFLQKELSMNDTLLKGGYSSQLRVYELKRNRAQFNANLIDLKGRLQNTELAQLQAEQEKIALQHKYIAEIGRELQDVNKSKDDTLEQLVQAKDVLSRVVITSPHQGKVVGLTVFNRGDVISPGETLLEVVPVDERMIVVATLKPEDIDVVNIGQSALIRLSAYNFRTTPPINGTIIHVAADRLLESKQEQERAGFKIKISLDKGELDNLKGVSLHPGMPAEVYVHLHSRTPIDYLLEPLSLDLYKAFREL